MLSSKNTGNINDDQQQKDLKMITTSIDACTDDEEEEELYLKRITIYFETSEWKKVLKDIKFLEGKHGIDDNIRTLKWKSQIHQYMAHMRNSIEREIGLNIYKNKEHMNLVLNITEENVDDMINKNQKQTKKRRII